MPRTKSKHPPASWAELPHKFQLAMLVMARLSEPLTMSSLRSYMYYQLKSFDPSLSDGAVSAQAGYVTSAFMFSQFLTAIAWGKAADSEYLGRKKVLLIGLLGTGIASIGFGFSQTFWTAIAFRIIGGMLNGNVGVMRTMVSEMMKEKRHQSRAFMLLPMTGNIGQIIGPMLGGFLADPVTQYPNIFGPNTLLGGKTGVQWMINYPYALPNLVSACFLMGSAMIIIFGLEETHYLLRDKLDWGIELRKYLQKRFFPKSTEIQYAPVPTDESPYNPFAPDYELRDTPLSSPIRSTPKPPTKKQALQKRNKLPFRRIFTRNVVITLLSRGLLAMHIGTFQNLWYIFLSTPRAQGVQESNLYFSGGLALPPNRIGIVLSIIGSIGIFFQLIAYPPLSAKFGTLLCYRASLVLFPFAYFFAPFLAILPSSTLPPLPSSGVIVWLGLLGVLFVHVLARTFAMPSATILVNNCCPHPSVLSTVHGVAQTVSSGMRMLGPLFGGWAFAFALNIHFVALPFWVMLVFSALAAVLSLWVREGDGHEIKLEGEEEEVEEDQEDEMREKEAIERNDVEISGGLNRREQNVGTGRETP